MTSSSRLEVSAVGWLEQERGVGSRTLVMKSTDREGEGEE